MTLCLHVICNHKADWPTDHSFAHSRLGLAQLLNLCGRDNFYLVQLSIFIYSRQVTVLPTFHLPPTNPLPLFNLTIFVSFSCVYYWYWLRFVLILIIDLLNHCVLYSKTDGNTLCVLYLIDQTVLNLFCSIEFELQFLVLISSILIFSMTECVNAICVKRCLLVSNY